MDNNLTQIILGVIVALPGLIALQSTIKQNNAKANHDKTDEQRISSVVANQLTDAAGDLIAQYKKYADEIYMELDGVKAEFTEYKKESNKQTNLCNEKIKAWETKLLSMQVTIEALRRRITEYRQGVMILSEQIKGLGEKPRYTPPEEDETHG